MTSPLEVNLKFPFTWRHFYLAVLVMILCYMVASTVTIEESNLLLHSVSIKDFPPWGHSTASTDFFFFLRFFLMWTIFKVFIEFVTILLLFYVLVFWPRGMWDLSSPTRNRTRTPFIGRRSLNHWTPREVPSTSF